MKKNTIVLVTLGILFILIIAGCSKPNATATQPFNNSVQTSTQPVIAQDDNTTLNQAFNDVLDESDDIAIENSTE